MRRITLHTAILLLLLCVSLQASAQHRKRVIEVDTTKVAFINGITVHAELIGAYQMLNTDHGQWEAGMRLNILDRYFPAFEIGYGEADEHEDYNETSNFQTKAPFFRVGADYNILRNKHDDYKLFGGVRYGFSKFSYDMTAPETTTDELGEELTTYVQHTSLNATCHWLEFVFGVDAKVWGPLHLGWDVRYRRKLNFSYADELQPWYIPGFGNYKNAGFFAAFNLTFGF